MSSTANNSAPGEIIAAIVVNGQEVGSNITKPAGYFSTTIVLNPPIELHPGDRINFRSKNNNHQVKQTIISLIAFDVRRTLRNLWGSCGRWDTCACQA